MIKNKQPPSAEVSEIIYKKMLESHMQSRILKP